MKTVVLYQLKEDNPNFNKNYDSNTFDMRQYEIVFEGERGDLYSPTNAYYEFNNKFPTECTGRKIEVSDVIGIGENVFYHNTNSWIKLKEEDYV